MSDPQKRHCSLAGCRAWAQHGESLCASHLRASSARTGAPQLLSLLRAVNGAGHSRRLDDIQLIDAELRQLLETREEFAAWARKLRDEGSKPGLNPAQFLRAWNDSTTRILQLLRARRDLGGNKEGEFDDLVRRVYDELERNIEPSGRPDRSS